MIATSTTTPPRWRVLLLAGWALAAGGCAAFTAPPSQTQKTTATMTGTSNAPPPLVQNCGIVSIGSPTKYACDGKVYTSFELHKLRDDWAKSHPG